MTFQTTHKLDYLQSAEGTDVGEARMMHGFRVGTCHGLYYQDKEAVCLLAIHNDDPGNGHFTDVLEWFAYSAKNQGLHFDVVEVWNKRLKWHLIDKRGFVAIDQFRVRKVTKT